MKLYTHFENPQNCVLHHLEIAVPKTKEIPHDFLLITTRNFISFLIDRWNSHILFFNTPRNVLNLLVWTFSGIAQLAMPKKLLIMIW